MIRLFNSDFNSQSPSTASSSSSSSAPRLPNAALFASSSSSSGKPCNLRNTTSVSFARAPFAPPPA